METIKTDYLHIGNDKKINQFDGDWNLKTLDDDKYVFSVKHRRQSYEVHLLRNGRDGEWKLEIGNNVSKLERKLKRDEIQHLPTFVFWLNAFVREWIIQDHKNLLHGKR